MKYQESNLVELKRNVEDNMITEIIAFLNSHLGGTIHVGVEDDGQLSNLTKEQKDLYESKIINWIRDEAIYPNCSNYINISYNEDYVMKIAIESGNNKPYYLKSKGLKPSGVYIRYGRNKSQATPEEISTMIQESSTTPYEAYISPEQELTFNTLKNKYEQNNMNFDNFKMTTSGFIDRKSKLYTNIAYWFSDQYTIETKVAVYQGIDRDIFKSKKEFGGSIIKQIDDVLDYFNLCNFVRVIIDGSPTRTEIPSFKYRAAREAILNCYCHRNFQLKSNIKIEY